LEQEDKFPYFLSSATDRKLLLVLATIPCWNYAAGAMNYENAGLWVIQNYHEHYKESESEIQLFYLHRSASTRTTQENPVP